LAQKKIWRGAQNLRTRRHGKNPYMLVLGEKAQQATLPHSNSRRRRHRTEGANRKSPARIIPNQKCTKKYQQILATPPGTPRSLAHAHTHPPSGPPAVASRFSPTSLPRAKTVREIASGYSRPIQSAAKFSLTSASPRQSSCSAGVPTALPAFLRPADSGSRCFRRERRSQSELHGVPHSAVESQRGQWNRSANSFRHPPPPVTL